MAITHTLMADHNTQVPISYVSSFILVLLFQVVRECLTMDLLKPNIGNDKIGFTRVFKKEMPKYHSMEMFKKIMNELCSNIKYRFENT